MTQPRADVPRRGVAETPAGDEVLAADRPLADAAAETSALRRARRRSAVLGVVLLTIATVMGLAFVGARNHPWFQPVDDWWRSFVVRHRYPWLVDVAKALGVIGSAWVTLPLRILAGIVLAVRRRWLQFAAFATAIITSEILVGVVKALVDRDRPPGRLVEATGQSFPSGHAIAASVTAFGLVAAFLPRGTRRWHWLVGATFFAAAMAWSRTYLSAHWFTDTIAGTCIGVGIALLTEAAFEGGRHTVAEVAEFAEAVEADGADHVSREPERAPPSGEAAPSRP